MGSDMKPTVVFWYEFASSYSYLSAMRISDAASRAGVEVDWRPFLLGPIFKSQGWETSPFNLFPAKGRYMVRDIARTASARGLPFQMPATFPPNGLKAARLALAAKMEGSSDRFSRAVFTAAFGKGLDIFNNDVLTECMLEAGLDPQKTRALAADPSVKTALRVVTDEAMTRRIFGSPTFTTGDGELFWGDDRLDQALAWAIAPMRVKS